jgi:MSHA biogenesis protein MshK
MVKYIVSIGCFICIMVAFASPLRDPTEPPIGISIVDSKEGHEGIVINSIIVSRARRIALINGEYVKAGDMIGGKKVISIRRNYVLFSQNGKKFKVYLIEGDVRKR